MAANNKIGFWSLYLWFFTALECVCVYMSEVNLIEKFIDWGFNGERSIKSCSLSLQSLFLCENCNKNFHWIFFCLVYLRFPQPASSFRQKKRKKKLSCAFHNNEIYYHSLLYHRIFPNKISRESQISFISFENIHLLSLYKST